MSVSALQTLSTLLVEPSSAQQKIISAYLHKIGIVSINCVKNGQQAVDFMHKQSPDMVISAMHLEGMTGTELVQTMRMDEGLRDIPFMLISSETHYRYLEPIRQAGVIAILPKPFTLQQLEKAIESALHFVNPGELNTSAFDGEELKVLVVDDSFTARRHIIRVLKNMGIADVVEAENGAQALQKIKESYFDVVVTDYNMPVMDGKEFVEEVRKNSSQATIPILMVSSETDQSRLSAIQQVGVSAVCDKPFDSLEVKMLLQRILD